MDHIAAAPAEVGSHLVGVGRVSQAGDVCESVLPVDGDSPEAPGSGRV